MASTSYKTFLMMAEGTGNTFAKLVDIKDYPDLGKERDIVDMTTLSDGSKWGMPDIDDPGNLAFNCNYDPTDYATIKAIEGTEKTFAVWFGGTEGDDGTVTPTGSEGKFQFKGLATVLVKGAGVSGSRDMVVNIAPRTKPTKVSS